MSDKNELLTGSSNYISLQEAAKLCNYSQEYLSLRARQGKLQAIKLGRNWVTTKERLAEYINNAEEYNNNVNGKKIIKQFFVVPEKEVTSLPPENLPVGEPKAIAVGPTLIDRLTPSFENIRPVLVAILVTVLIGAGGVFGKESLTQVYNDVSPFVKKVHSEIDNQFSAYTEIMKSAGVAALEKIGRQTISVDGQNLTIEFAAAGISNLWQGYTEWISGEILAVWRKIEEGPVGRRYVIFDKLIEEGLSRDIKTIVRNYSATSEFFGKGLSEDFGKISDSYSKANNTTEKIIEKIIVGYSSADNFVEEKIKKGYQIVANSLKKTYRFITIPWREDLVVVPGVPFEEIEKLKAELEKLKEEPMVVKRVEVERMVEQVREITREVERVEQVTKIDDEALKMVKQDIAYLEEEIGKRLYAPGGVVSQTIYVTEPVSSPKIYQENGEIVLQTLGSGNVIISAATGLQLHGQQVVIQSTSLLSPLIYLASNTRIDGDVTVTGSISGGALSVSSAAISGDATVGGNLTVSGDLTVSGAQAFAGHLSITASSTEPALKVTQNGTGNIVQFLDGGTNVFTISDGGYTSLATAPSVTNPAFLFQTSDVTNWATGTATFLGINATSTFSGNFLDFQKNGTSLFSIASDGSLVSSASITAVTFVSADDDSTVRKSGEEVFREIMPIDRYDIPAQTGTTTYFRISKYFAANPLSSTPESLPGATRVYKLIIKYADDIPTNSSSSWRIYQRDGAITSDTFTLLGRNMSSLAEGIATTTANLIIPNTDWQVEVKLSEDDSGKTIRIFQIFLAAYDKIN